MKCTGIKLLLAAAVCAGLLAGCASNKKTSGTKEHTLPSMGPVIGTESKEETSSADITTAPAPSTEETTEATVIPSSSAKPVEKDKIIVIDAGHQDHGNNEKEPLGPGSDVMKTKVATGTQGRTTRVPEYVVNLQVALKVQKLLEERGYQVIMIRTTNDVNISNAERAQIANEAGADAFVRLHCNGVDNTTVNGILAIMQSRNNPWNGDRYDVCYKLSTAIVNAMCEVTGAKNMAIQLSDTMTGINWAQVPATLIEMGFMTNPEEDVLLTTDSYQDKLALGVANGIDAFFASK